MNKLSGTGAGTGTGTILATSWEIIDTGNADAEYNMELDRQLLSNVSKRQKPLIRFYGWTFPSATYGHFAKPHLYLKSSSIAQHQLHLAKRPTGGGILLHLTDFTFSVLLPATHPSFSLNTIENYAFVNQIVANAIQKLFQYEAYLLTAESNALDPACNCFCMSQPTKYDVMLNGYKVSGGAQRRTRFGFLHQGTVALQKPPQELLEDLFLPGNKILEGMRQYSGALISDESSLQALEKARIELKKCIIDSLRA